MPISPDILAVAQEIEQLVHPEKIILFSTKTNLQGETTSFKLCLVCAAAQEEKASLERKIYLTVDSPVPYDLVLYTTQEFEAMEKIPGSFAHKVQGQGRQLL